MFEGVKIVLKGGQRKGADGKRLRFVVATLWYSGESPESLFKQGFWWEREAFEKSNAAGAVALAVNKVLKDRKPHDKTNWRTAQSIVNSMIDEDKTIPATITSDMLEPLWMLEKMR